MPDFDINDVANALGGEATFYGQPARARADAGTTTSADVTTGPQSFAPVAVPAVPISGPHDHFAVLNSGSPESRLPPAALAKLRGLKSMAADLLAITRAASDRLADAQQDLQRAEQRLGNLRAANIGGRNDTAVREATERRDAALAERNRAAAEVDARVERARPLRELMVHVERFIERELASVSIIEPAPAITVPELRKSQTWADAVAEVRAKIEKAAADKRAALDAPQPSEAAKQRARQEIEQLAERGRPSVMALIESPNGGIEWPQRYEGAGLAMDGFRVVGRVGRDGYVHDPMALVLWANKDSILQAIEREIDAKADDRSALTAEQRQKKVAQAEQARFEAELIEERLIEQAAQAGVAIQRRDDADPRCVLGLAANMPAPKRCL